MTLQTDLKTAAANLHDDARDAVAAKVGEKTDQLRDDAVTRVTNVANAAQAASAEFDAGSLQAQAADQIAQQVEGIATKLRNTDLPTITRDVSDFARKNPALFIGAAALLGFAATRFLKARDPHPDRYQHGDADPWGTSEHGAADVPS